MFRSERLREDRIALKAASEMLQFVFLSKETEKRLADLKDFLEREIAELEREQLDQACA